MSTNFGLMQMEQAVQDCRLNLPSDWSSFYWNIYNLLICFFIGVFLLTPSFRLICGLEPPSGRVRSTEFSLMEKLDLIWGLVGTMTVGVMATELIPDSCWLLGLLSFRISFSDELSESASADSVRSLRLVTRLLSECFDSVSGLAWALRLLTIDSRLSFPGLMKLASSSSELLLLSKRLSRSFLFLWSSRSSCPKKLMF